MCDYRNINPGNVVFRKYSLKKKRKKVDFYGYFSIIFNNFVRNYFVKNEYDRYFLFFSRIVYIYVATFET